MDSHIAAVMRLGLDEAGVTELMAAADHARGLTKLAAGLRLEPDIAAPSPRRGLVAPPEAEPGERVAALLEEARRWAADELGVDRIPALWGSLAHHPVYLEAVFRREQTIMADGRLGKFHKRAIGYAVAANTVSPYMVEWYTTALRRLGADDRAFVEMLAVVDYFNNLNTLADGMEIESDIAPYRRYE